MFQRALSPLPGSGGGNKYERYEGTINLSTTPYDTGVKLNNNCYFDAIVHSSAREVTYWDNVNEQFVMRAGGINSYSGTMLTVLENGNIGIAKQSGTAAAGSEINYVLFAD